MMEIDDEFSLFDGQGNLEYLIRKEIHQG